MAFTERRTWIILSFFLVSAFVLQFLGCALFGSWWPMLVYVLYIFIPMPYLFFGAGSDSLFVDTDSLWTDCGKFLTGFSSVGLLAIPISLYQADYIESGALVLELLSVVFLFLAVLYYDYHSSRDYVF